MLPGRGLTHTNAILFAVFAVIVLVFVWFWITDPTHTVEETTGMIEAVTVQPSRSGHAGADRTAMIRLENGIFIHAKVVTPMNVRSGQRAKVVVSEKVLSGTRTYEVVDAADVR